jgi:hypothetical protein
VARITIERFMAVAYDCWMEDAVWFPREPENTAIDEKVVTGTSFGE